MEKIKALLARTAEVINNNRRIVGGFAAVLVVGAGIGIFIVSTDTPEYVPPEVVEPNAQDPDKSKVLPEGGSENRAGGILITPSYQEKTVDVGSKIDPISVTNRSPNPVTITVNYVPLTGNSLVGKPEYDVRPETIRLGKRMVRPDATVFKLLPKATRVVNGTVVGRPKDSVGMYGVMTFGIDDGSKPKPSEEFKDGVRLAVKQRTRVGAIVLLRFPGEVQESVRTDKISAVEEEGEVQIKARVTNTGNYLVRPTGNVVVSSNDTGRVISSQPFVPRQGIIPGDDRDLIIPQGLQNLPPGDYTVTVQVEAGGRARAAASAFRIDENGNLPTPDAEYIITIRPGNIVPGKDFEAFIQLRNTGTREFTPQGTAALYRYGSEKAILSDEFQMGSVSPNSLVDTTLSFPGQPEEGNYEVVVEMFSEDGLDMGEKAASVFITDGKDESPSPVDRIRDWLSEHPTGGIFIGILLVGLLLGGIIFLAERRRRNA